MKKLFYWVCVLLAATTIAACSSNDDFYPNNTNGIKSTMLTTSTVSNHASLRLAKRIWGTTEQPSPEERNGNVFGLG